MKLHLPKGLFIAVLAAISSILPTTFGADNTISVNFTGSEKKQVTESSTGTLGDVDYTGWNNITCQAGSSNLKDNNGVEKAATLVLGYDKGSSNKDSMGSYHSVTNPNKTVTGDVQRGYIDVWNTGENHYTISLTHNYWLYDAIFYMSGDNADATFAPMEVNGTAYIGGTDVLATDANKAWGSGYTTGCTEYTDNNRVTVTSQIGHTLLATNVWNGTTSRATLAGLQVVDRSADGGYRTTLGSGETAASSATWTLGGETVDYASIPAGKKYLGISANAAGSTIRLAGGETVDSLAAIANNLTITADSAVSISDLYTFSEAGITLNTTATVNSLRGDVNLQISQNNSLNLSGLVTLSKTSAITGNGTVIVQDGAVLEVKREGEHAAIQSHISVKGGGELKLANNDALGWGNITKSITLLGSSDSKLATLALWGRQTMATELHMQGNAIVTSNGTGSGDYQPGINAYKRNGAIINVQGKNNTIAAALHTRDSFHITVADGGELLVSGQVRPVGGAKGYDSDKNPNGYETGSVVKLGEGSITFTNAANTFTKKYFNMAGETIFAHDENATGVAAHTFEKGIQISGGKVTFGEGIDVNLTGSVNIASEGTMQINQMEYQDDINTLLSSATGTGTIELKTNAVFEGATTNDGNGNALGNIASIAPKRMLFEGDIKVSNKARLSIGSSAEDHRWGYYTDLSALKSIQLTDAQLFYTGRSCTLQSLIINTGTEADYTSSLRIWEIDQNEALTINSLTLHEDLEVQANWNMALNINALTGAGNLKLGSNAKTGGNAVYNVTVGAGYTGIISVLNKYEGTGDSTDRSSLAVTIAKDATLKSNQLVKGANGTVTLKGSGSYEIDKNAVSTAVINGLSADTWTGKVAFSGAAFNNTDLNNYGNAGSTISIHKSSGTVEDGTILSDIELVETSGASAFDLQTTKAVNLVFAGDISGKGNFGYVKNSGHNVSFTGNVEKWAGVLWASADSTITYSGNAKVIRNEITAGKGNTESGAKSTVKFVNSSGMTVKSNINSNYYTNGTLNLVVSNDANAANPTGVVEFAEGTIGSNGTTNLTVETGAAAKFSNSAVQFNDILVEAQAQLSFTGKEALSVSKLEMQQGAAVSVGTIEKPQGTLTVTEEAVFNGGQVQANLTLGSDAKVTMGSALTMGTTTATASETGSTASTGYTLSLETGLTLKLTGDMLSKFNALTPDSGELVLFTGVNTLVLGGQPYTNTELAKDNGVKLSDYITVEGAYACNEYYIGFRDGNVFAGMIVPEPTTATLSLLALAGLCARRRRK